LFEKCSSDCLDKAISILNAISHPLRFEIIKQLSNGPKYNRDIKKIFPEYDPSNITKHLNVLKDHHIIESVKEGRETYYVLKFQDIPSILMSLRKFIYEEFPHTD